MSRISNAKDKETTAAGGRRGRGPRPPVIPYRCLGRPCRLSLSRCMCVWVWTSRLAPPPPPPPPPPPSWPHLAEHAAMAAAKSRLDLPTSPAAHAARRGRHA